MKVNRCFGQVKETYLFVEIARKTEKYAAEHPQADIIKLGIGDVTRPLPRACIEAMHKAVDEMGQAQTFRGYSPDMGYVFLREAIAAHDYRARGCDISIDEIFISDGAKSDIANITDLIGEGNIIGIPDPVYPVYVDSNILAGNAGEPQGEGFTQLRYLPCLPEKGFKPAIPTEHLDIIYLCSPNNPTGSAMTKAELTAWVEYALDNDAIILFDSAYEAFITEPDIPHSIYEIKGAEHCAVEIRSFSKTGGFTGTRCAYTVVPDGIEMSDGAGNKLNLNKMWKRRQGTKFNGVPYIVQRGAEALFTPEGYAQAMENIRVYLGNAAAIRAGFEKKNMTVYGGINAPYVWVKVPEQYDSWGFFDLLLNEYAVVGTPGAGFGKMGEGYMRLTGFGDVERTKEAVRRLSSL